MKPVALWWQQPKACLQLPGLAESPPGPPSWVSDHTQKALGQTQTVTSGLHRPHPAPVAQGLLLFSVSGHPRPLSPGHETSGGL